MGMRPAVAVAVCRVNDPVLVHNDGIWHHLDNLGTMAVAVAVIAPMAVITAMGVAMAMTVAGIAHL